MKPKIEMWWAADEGKVHEVLLDYVHQVEERQSEYFERFAMLESMYDPNGPVAQQADARWREDLKRITENVIATTVDTMCSEVATTDVLARFMTDGADWETQQRAELLEQYSEEIAKQLDIMDKCREGFFGGTKKGTGLNKVYADQDNRLHVEPVMVDNIVVDDAECQNGAAPRQLHYRQVDYDRDVLKQQFPDKAEEIEQLGASGRGRYARWMRTTMATRNNVLVLESWLLPMGDPDDAENYVPGRHVIVAEGLDLLDEEYDKPYFPFSVYRHGKREGSFYGISLAERIIGHQRTLNKRNWQRDRQLDQVALPVTYLRPVDINARVQTTQAGTFVPIKGDFPVTIVPQAVGPEIQQDRHDAKASALEETGISRMSAYAQKPAGIDSGAGLREHRDQATQRFSRQEKGFEKYVLATVELALAVCKDLGKDAPKMSRRSRFAPRVIKWGDVDMKDVRVQIAAASTLNRTPAGRVQFVLELAQAGAISMDETRRLLKHPDLEDALSLYTAALEAIEEDLFLIKRGVPVVPEPFINLKMAAWRGQNHYLRDRGRGAPEDVLEAIRTYVVQAIHLSNQAAAAGAVTQPSGMTPPATSPQQVPAAGPPLLPPPQGA